MPPADDPSIVKVGRILGSILAGPALAEALDLYRAAGLVLIREQLLAVILGFALATIFIVKPFRRGATRDRAPWYDVV
jgi:TRAP-type uncharacterized transport system fused permease subunit